MSFRPNASEWLPLCTQQMRLRNLISIRGLNIECNIDAALHREASIYYTLHEPCDGGRLLYKSESLPVWHVQLNWNEIELDDELRTSNLKCVCIKVWSTLEPQWYKQKKKKTSSSEFEEPPDRVLFTWGVNFNGLARASLAQTTTFRPNTLIFHFNGDYFTSVVAFTAQGLRNQVSLECQRLASMQPASRSLMGINSPQSSRSVNLTAHTDDEIELRHMLLSRNRELYCQRAEVRESYELSTLLALQKSQRLRLQYERESDELRDQFERTTIRAPLKLEDLPLEPTTQAATSLHFTTLNELFAEQQKVSPRTLYQRRQLQLQVEQLTSRRNRLEWQRASYSKRIAERRTVLDQKRTQRLQAAAELAARRAQLESERNALAELKALLGSGREEQSTLQSSLEHRRATMCGQLRRIFNIASHPSEPLLHTICGVPFPKAVGGKQQTMANQALITDCEMNAALGYIAHLVQLISTIVDRPLRNPIVYEPSRTEIRGLVKNINKDYEYKNYPLYINAKGGTSKLTSFAIHLLNQNIAQICYELTGRCSNFSASIENLVAIFNALKCTKSNRCQLAGAVAATSSSTQPTTDVVDSPALAKRMADVTFFESQSSIDVPLALMSTADPISSKPSVGSYNHSKQSQGERIYRSADIFPEPDYETDRQRTGVIERMHSQSESDIAFQLEER